MGNYLVYIELSERVLDSWKVPNKAVDAVRFELYASLVTSHLGAFRAEICARRLKEVSGEIVRPGISKITVHTLVQRSSFSCLRDILDLSNVSR